MKKDRPIYFTVRRMVDPETGEESGCLVPASWADNQIMRQRAYRKNDQVRAVIQHPRCTKFHRLVHQLGTMIRDNVPGFEHMDSHAVIKRLQAESGVYCEDVQADARPIVRAICEAFGGTMYHAQVKTALDGIELLTAKIGRSIAYDSMDEEEFRQFWEGICRHVVDKYWPTLEPWQVEEMAQVMPNIGSM